MSPNATKLYLSGTFSSSAAGLGFLAVAYLASLLSHLLRSKGQELDAKREELLELQDFTQDIIHSMRGGLLTTDGEGRIVVLNRTGEEILEKTFHELRGVSLRDWNGDFWLPELMTGKEKAGLRKEIDYRTPSGKQRFLGISVSLLRSRESGRSGYVFNFQDLTDLRRLEQEVATKERMAALGRLSAAIAHEIRQPLTAMAGAVMELGRMVPLEEDEQHLVQIVRPAHRTGCRGGARGVGTLYSPARHLFPRPPDVGQRLAGVAARAGFVFGLAAVRAAVRGNPG